MSSLFLHGITGVKIGEKLEKRAGYDKSDYWVMDLEIVDEKGDAFVIHLFSPSKEPIKLEAPERVATACACDCTCDASQEEERKRAYGEYCAAKSESLESEHPSIEKMAEAYEGLTPKRGESC